MLHACFTLFFTCFVVPPSYAQAEQYACPPLGGANALILPLSPALAAVAASDNYEGKVLVSVTLQVRAGCAPGVCSDSVANCRPCPPPSFQEKTSEPLQFSMPCLITDTMGAGLRCNLPAGASLSQGDATLTVGTIAAARPALRKLGTRSRSKTPTISKTSSVTPPASASGTPGASSTPTALPSPTMTATATPSTIPAAAAATSGSSSPSYSGGTVAGIVIGTLVGAVLLVLAVYMYRRKQSEDESRKRRRIIAHASNSNSSLFAAPPAAHSPPAASRKEVPAPAFSSTDSESLPQKRRSRKKRSRRSRSLHRDRRDSSVRSRHRSASPRQVYASDDEAPIVLRSRAEMLAEDNLHSRMRSTETDASLIDHLVEVRPHCLCVCV